MNHKKMYECIYFFLCMVIIVTVDGYNSESFQSRASQGRPKTDVLSSKTKVLIFKRCPKISEKCEGLFWCLDHTGSRPRQADRRAQAMKTRSMLSQFPSRHSARQTHILRNCKHIFYRGKHTLLLIANKSIHHTWHLSFFNTTAIWGQETLQLHLKVRKLPRPLPPPRNMRGCGCTYCDYIFCRGGKQCATNLQFLASHHPDDHA